MNTDETPFFWKCHCPKGTIHTVKKKSCVFCGEVEFSAPRATVNEVKELFPDGIPSNRIVQGMLVSLADDTVVVLKDQQSGNIRRGKAIAQLRGEFLIVGDTSSFYLHDVAKVYFCDEEYFFTQDEAMLPFIKPLDTKRGRDTRDILRELGF